MFPSFPKFLPEAYQVCTAKPRGYVLIDLNIEQNPNFRVRSSIFNEQDTIIFSPV